MAAENESAGRLRRELNALVLELDRLCAEDDEEYTFNDDYRGDQLTLWRDRAIEWLNANLGEHYGARLREKRVGSWGNPEGSIADRNRAWRNYLLSLGNDITDHPDRYTSDHRLAETTTPQAPRVADLIGILRRFHAAATQLRLRHNGRHPYEIDDEFDVQDLVHALLRATFDDVRREEASPSLAGANSRIDLYVPCISTAVEVKFVTAKLRDRQVGEQLLIDIARYRKHPCCSSLICFVYDPAHRLANPAGLVSDLSRVNGELNVTVVISPGPN